MITFEEAIEMKILSKQGNSIRNIAKDMQRARNTVRKYLRTEQAPEYKKRATRPSKLQKYENYLITRVQKAIPHRLFAPALLRDES